MKIPFGFLGGGKDTPTVINTGSTVTTSTFTINADVVSEGLEGPVLTRGLIFIPASLGNIDPQLGDAGITDIPIAGTLGAITHTETGLPDGTEYYWRAYATNAAGISYSPTLSLLTDPNALTIYYLTDNNPVDLFTVNTIDDPQEFTVRWVPIDSNKQTVEKDYNFAQGTGVHSISELIYEAGGTSQYYKMLIFGPSLTNISLLSEIGFRNPRILNWGNNPWKFLTGAFQFSTALGMAATDAPNLTQCTSLRNLFSSSRYIGVVYNGDFDGNGIRRNGDWTGWDVSNVVDAAYMFENCKRFTADLGAWSWDNAEDLSYFFANTQASGSHSGGNVDFSQWVNVGKVGGLINLEGFYQFAQQQTKPILNLNNVRPNRIKLNEFTFAASSLTEDLSSWGPKISALQPYDPAVGVSLQNFLRYRDFDQVTDFSTWDLSNVVSTFSMFSQYRFANGVTGLNNITWANTGINRSWTAMFLNAVNIPDISNWSFSDVGSFALMFSNASFANPAQSLNSWTMSSNFGYLSSKLDFRSMFQNIESTNGQVPAVDAWVINQLVVPGDPEPHIDFRLMFAENPNFNQDLTNWAVQNIVDIREMFRLCDNFNSGDAQGVYGNKLLTWNVELKDAYQAFYRATNFNQNIGHWTWKQGSTQGMFATNNNGVNKMNFDQDISGWGFGAGNVGFQSVNQFESFHVNADGTNQFSTANLDSLLISIAQNILNSGNTNGKTNIVFQVDGQPSCLPAATGGPYNVAADILGVQDAIAYLNETLGWTITTNACI